MSGICTESTVQTRYITECFCFFVARAPLPAVRIYKSIPPLPTRLRCKQKSRQSLRCKQESRQRRSNASKEYIGQSKRRTVHAHLTAFAARSLRLPLGLLGLLVLVDHLLDRLDCPAPYELALGFTGVQPLVLLKLLWIRLLRS